MSVNNISGDEDSSCEESEIKKSQFGLLPHQFEPVEVADLYAKIEISTLAMKGKFKAFTIY